MAVNFAVGAESAQLELGADSGDAARAQKAMLRWDRKRKKMVHVDPVSSEFRPHWVKHNERVAKKSAEAKSKEFKNKQQIVKERIRKEKIKQKLKYKNNKKKKRK
ncbi:hypothetical protein HF086_015487 [Spodoptera exigua]|uniref:Uncharacterized protein n=1 Tax=Spodoptera exigua TaxID=7107 RepID=A0A922MEL5_SPOEX|nr:hypothetical protein HF086_015487 [Spodoptera exigua]